MEISGSTVLVTGANRGLGRQLVDTFAEPFTADRDAIAREMTTNYLGSLDVVRAFAPVIEANGGGAIVNVLSVVALAGHPPMASYAASKAAAHSMTQAIRPGLADRGIVVHGVYPAGIDTEMIADIEGPRTPPRQVAEGILAGIEKGEEDIFPDPISQSLSPMWFSDPKAYERAFSGR